MMVSKGFTLQFVYILVFPTSYEIQKSVSFEKWHGEILTESLETEVKWLLLWEFQ